MINTKTIFSKLFFSYALIIFLSFLLFGIVFIYMFHLNLYEDYEELYVYHSEQLEENLEYALDNNWTDEETGALLETSLSHRDYSIIIYDDNGSPLFTPESSRTNIDDLDQQYIRTAAQGNPVSAGTRLNGSLSYVIADKLNVQETGGETFVTAMVFHDLDHQYYQMGAMILLPFTVTIAFAGGILFLISRKITAPLRDMNEIALKLAKGDFSQTVKVSSQDEVGQLGETFNYMAAELNGLEEMRKDFIANVSHDLRSPLTSLKGFLVALLDGTIPNEKREHYYTLMKDETDRVIKLVNDTLDMSKLENGQVELLIEPYNLTKQLQEIVTKLEPQLNKKSMRIIIEPKTTEFYAEADRDKIEQVLINLLQNAIQFSPKKSEVLVSIEEHTDELTVTIADNGQGIAEEDMPYIWERFSKADRSRTNKSGTGIGLSIVKSIIDLHGCEIRVESVEGSGTVFSFNLPKADEIT
ncbi:HAMP domain-containing sensor histidine kinase [Salisediminibacterium halotolerans]|uniref:HAMP domain-containing sensor histidine kinase n=2 Tax=Salisediminibacterium halotolerans TaxID=517425 RepID=UPI000EAE79E1|nr:HAMP domain-containing sensor histidine kinase [Salisediminibacterium halotolerans]RLJ72260.1 signal transduction histidine kinase [Actinophytocola xinjiangensis]RPE85474.1 signal transduction histidine kinase [Salisediminibacterium halotolerans]TWG33429.1 signal transduction histidine kinase [Salisediminibacterium halotolerans]GEL07041.1 hypothetical protein SHA02_04570 [Salisediminibacterium halotolerans]